MFIIYLFVLVWSAFLTNTDLRLTDESPQAYDDTWEIKCFFRFIIGSTRSLNRVLRQLERLV